jgi:two-component system sensor histidine kinase DegS
VITGDETTLYPRTKIFLFRIVQEALSNVQKHARASHITAQLAIGREALTATITDDGVGFDVEAVSRDPEKWDHFGVRGIVERARLVGGEAVIESKKGHGTKVVIRVPLTKADRESGS